MLIEVMEVWFSGCIVMQSRTFSDSWKFHLVLLQLDLYANCAYVFVKGMSSCGTYHNH
jgi:hypothetical protein